MKKAYLMPQNNVVKTRIRASILAGSNTGTNVNAGKAQESLNLNSTSGGGTQSQPGSTTKGTIHGIFGE